MKSHDRVSSSNEHNSEVALFFLCTESDLNTKRNSPPLNVRHSPIARLFVGRGSPAGV
jgi:hypothetical protein